MSTTSLPSTASISSIWLDMPDGVRLHVEHSRLSAPACVLVHGYGEAGHVWHETRAALAALCATVTVDLRGHGDSQRAPAGYDVATQLRDVRHVIARLGLVRPILVGHSLGGEIAARIAAAAPRDVAGLVVVDACPDPTLIGRVHVADNFRASLRAFRSPEAYEDWLIETRPLLSRAMAGRLARRSLCERDGGFWIKADPALARDPATEPVEDWTALLAAITCPALVIRGAMSALVREASAVQMVRQLPRGRLAVIPRAGHAVMSDNEAAFTAVVHDFVQTVVAS